MQRARTLGELRRSGYTPVTVKQEMRKNLIDRIKKGEELFPGIIGYEESVIPEIENAIISEQDVILLGERGQAKSRLARTLLNLLDDEIPIVAGSEINDNPFAPISRYAAERIEAEGDDTEITWLPRDRRYGEKLATPDITIADLIGEVDPIKVAEGRYLSDELTIHFGLLPRTNRGIFCINELPDLAERIQVGLLNIMEERDVQIRGYKIRLPLDIFIVASANPEDYTNRGRIITPIKDRLGSQVRCHYPKDIADEVSIMEQEAQKLNLPDINVDTPGYMKEIIAEVTHLARKSPDISQRSGVSVRVSITNYENLQSNGVRRAIRLGESDVSPRISDLGSLVASTAGKIELETVGDVKEDRVIERLVQGAVVNVFNRYFSVEEFNDLVSAFDSGTVVEVGESTPSMEYMTQASALVGFRGAVTRLGVQNNPASIASAVEFVLEGLHLNRKINKDKLDGKARYRK
ncbi:MAG TPA: magnesium chelatase [Chloroflexota bacterium]